MDSILCLVKSACLPSGLNLQDILLDATGQIKNYYKVLQYNTWPQASLPTHAHEIGTQLWILQGITGIKITKTGGRCLEKKGRIMTPKACYLTWGCYSLSSSSWLRLQVEQSPAASCRWGSTNCCGSCCSGNYLAAGGRAVVEVLVTVCMGGILLLTGLL